MEPQLGRVYEGGVVQPRGIVSMAVDVLRLVVVMQRSWSCGGSLARTPGLDPGRGRAMALLE
jgi:hypothetical protein